MSNTKGIHDWVDDEFRANALHGARLHNDRKQPVRCKALQRVVEACHDCANLKAAMQSTRAWLWLCQHRDASQCHTAQLERHAAATWHVSPRDAHSELDVSAVQNQCIGYQWSQLGLSGNGAGFFEGDIVTCIASLQRDTRLKSFVLMMQNRPVDNGVICSLGTVTLTSQR